MCFIGMSYVVQCFLSDPDLCNVWSSRRGDNTGPPTSPEEVFTAFSRAESQFPGAVVEASTLDDAVADLSQATSLPVISSEVGDCWAYGIASDPLKLSRARAAMRVLASLGQTSDDQIVLFTRYLLKAAEHTWGLDVSRCISPWVHIPYFCLTVDLFR